MEALKEYMVGIHIIGKAEKIMRNIGIVLTAVLLCFIAFTADASVIVGRGVWCNGNCHEYVIVSFPAEIWDNAVTDLNTLIPGYHLSTITSQEENDFVSNLMISLNMYGEYWLGGFQEPINEPVPDKGWVWVTSEPWNYTNWASSEPNDGGIPAGEQHLTMYVYGEWNDEGSAIGAISGYIAESPGIVFVDVSPVYWAKEAICKIYNAGITQGCSQTPLKFCPDVVTNREQMAVFLGRGVHGSEFTPPNATGIFADVSLDHWAADWIEQAYNDGITQGCATNPLRYCPTVNVTRAQMAVFLLRAIHGGSYTPPAATGIFSDVDLSNWAAPWIEQLYNEGITVGCGTNPLRYCPDASVTRAQMAVFLMRAFELN